MYKEINSGWPTNIYGKPFFQELQHPQRSAFRECLKRMSTLAKPGNFQLQSSSWLIASSHQNASLCLIYLPSIFLSDPVQHYYKKFQNYMACTKMDRAILTSDELYQNMHHLSKYQADT